MAWTFMDEGVVYANRSCRELMHDPKEQTSLLSTGTMMNDGVDALWWVREEQR